jgi:hydrogenase expression/formation protein HypE
MEEGLERILLERISRSIGIASEKADVMVVTGDTKVVERGGVKGMLVTTAGIGGRHDMLHENLKRASGLRMEKGNKAISGSWLRDDQIKPGDLIILSGTVGDHGISLLSFREGYGFETELESDLASMGGLMDAAIKVGGVVSAKDLTRGGLANGLNEWAQKSGFGIDVEEDDIPLRDAVRSACDMLGLDPFEIGNEGKVILGVVPGSEEDVLKAVRSIPEGKDAQIIGKVRERKGKVVLNTGIGGKRIMDPPYGDPVPRIC